MKGGTGKLRSYWEEKVYIVVAKDEDIPVYTIKPEVGVGTTQRVHRNNIMNCNLLLEDAEEAQCVEELFDNYEESFAGFIVWGNESEESDESFASFAESVNESEVVLESRETEESTENDNQDDLPEERRSTRIRRKPQILTYDTVGVPIAKIRDGKI